MKLIHLIGMISSINLISANNNNNNIVDDFE